MLYIVTCRVAFMYQACSLKWVFVSHLTMMKTVISLESNLLAPYF